MPLSDTSESVHLASRLDRAHAEHAALCAKGQKIDMTRGKPSEAQLDLSNAMLGILANGDHRLASGADARNYFGGPQGLPEARELVSIMMGASPERIVVDGSSSLALMHDALVYALLKGVPGGDGPWMAAAPIAFLCPSPGYDRHFELCEQYGVRMIAVPLTGQGPDMDAVEELVRDPAVRGMWCVPKYSNPTGESYSDETVERLARMQTGAPDFRLFWDNAYAVHHLTERPVEIANILDLCERAGHADRALVFGSTSKMTFAGAGMAMLASSEANIRWFTANSSVRSIGPDKLSQLRHVRFLRDHEGIERLMADHRALLTPKFQAVEAALSERLSGTGFAEWTRPEGGYFVSVDTEDGCAARVIHLAAQAGVSMVPAGQTFPYRRDPQDRNLRIAPSYPSLAEVTAAAAAIALCVELAALEKRAAG